MTIWHWLRNIFKRPIPPQTKTVGYVDPFAFLPPAPHTSVVLSATKFNRKKKFKKCPTKFNRKKKFKKCPTMSKNMYTREQAGAALSRLTTKLKPLRIYLCEHCNTWHLTHKKNGYGR